MELNPADQSPSSRVPKSGGGLVVYALAVDLLLILVFAVTGRASHQEANPVLGVLITAWPFLAGAALGWLAGRLWRAPLKVWPHGVCLWLITVIAGMLLRVLSGRSAEWSFVLVTAIVLAVFLLGHRAIAALVLRKRASRAAVR